MKKFLTTVVVVTLALATAFGGAYAWFNASLVYSESYNIDVESSEGLVFTKTSSGGTLTPVTGTATTITDKDGNATTKYYEVTYNVTAPKKSFLYLNGITVNSELGKAVRVQTTFNSSARLFAPTGASYTTNTDSVSTTLGLLNGSGTLTVRIFLEGQDDACIPANSVDSLNIGLEFEAKEI